MSVLKISSIYMEKESTFYKLLVIYAWPKKKSFVPLSPPMG